ncbi:MAG: hypothetical protein ACXADY_23985 [Candidatus Hodarchaeales archaeon]|jgi:hypothetical protein
MKVIHGFWKKCPRALIKLKGDSPSETVDGQPQTKNCLENIIKSKYDTIVSLKGVAIDLAISTDTVKTMLIALQRGKRTYNKE